MRMKHRRIFGYGWLLIALGLCPWLSVPANAHSKHSKVVIQTDLHPPRITVYPGKPDIVVTITFEGQVQNISLRLSQFSDRTMTFIRPVRPTVILRKRPFRRNSFIRTYTVTRPAIFAPWQPLTLILEYDFSGEHYTAYTTVPPAPKLIITDRYRHFSRGKQ